jgi:hypothetical protein
VLLCSADDLSKYAGSIQGAIAFSLSYINDEQLDMLANGRDLPETDDTQPAGGGSSKK